MARTGSKGWHIEIEHEPSGRTIRPEIIDEIQERPRLNDLQRLDVPVPKDSRWFDESFENATARAWKDGIRKPIEELFDVEEQADRTILHLRGGIQLDQYIDDIEIQIEEADDAVDSILSDKTDYGRHIDDPSTETAEDVRVLQWATGDWEAVVEDHPDEPLTMGVGAKANEMANAQVGWWKEAEDGGAGSEVIVDDGDVLSGGEGLGLSPASDDGNNISISLDYEIEASDLWFEVSFSGWDDDEHPGLLFEFEDEEIEYRPPDTMAGRDLGDHRWVGGQVSNSASYGPGDVISPGSYTFSVSVEPDEDNGTELPGSGSIVADGMFVYDNSVVGPPPDGTIVQDDVITDSNVVLYTDVTFGTGAIPSAFLVEGGRLDVDMDEIDGNQLDISNDGGDTWISDMDTDSVSGVFADPTNEIRGRVTMDSLTTDPTTTPGSNDAANHIAQLDLFADLDDTPQVIGQHYRGDLIDILREIAEDGNWIFEVAWDRDQDGISIEWTQPGLRESAVDPDLVDYQIEKDSSEAYERAIIFGRSKSASATLNWSDYDSHLGVGQSWLVPGSETVVNADTGNELGYPEDYEVLWRQGSIALTDTGDGELDQDYDISFSWKIRGEYELPEADTDPRTIEREVPTAATRFECEQIALGLIKELQLAPIEAQVTIPRDDVSSGNLTRVIDLEQLPVDRSLRVNDLAHTPESVQLDLGLRADVQEIVSRLSERVGRVERQT